MGRKPRGVVPVPGSERQAAYRRRQEEARLAELRAKGLPALPVVPSMPGKRRWNVMLEQAAALLESVQSEMDAYHADRSEVWQESDRGQEFREVVDGLPDLVEQIREVKL